MTVWLSIIGIGEDGWEGLSASARAALGEAQVIIGGDRHHRLAADLPGERIHWPSPFRAMVDEIGSMAPRRVAVLVSGDPLWFSAGAYLARAFAGQCRIFPQLSAFQFAAARMGWSLADVDTLTIHGRPAEQIIPYFAPESRLLILTQDSSSPATVARLLSERGFGDSEMTVLGALGGPDETRSQGIAATWDQDAPEFHTLAVHCIASATPLPVTGLPDDAFIHDGQITKREVRTLSVAALNPRRGAVLWDIGAGSGSVGIEFMRAGRDTEVCAIEADATRAGMIATNARTLGAPRLKVIQGRAPDALGGLRTPDAVFIGGGLSRATVDIALGALAPFGRLVANAVTLESEALLATLAKEHGGTLSRHSIARAEPLGKTMGWRPMMPVTQWIFAK